MSLLRRSDRKAAAITLAIIALVAFIVASIGYFLAVPSLVVLGLVISLPSTIKAAAYGVTLIKTETEE